MKKALVTGGGGFLGQHIVRQLLDSGYSVRVIGRNKYSEVEKMGAESVVADICQIDQVKKVLDESFDEVYHVAALAGIWGDWEDYFEINYRGTLNIIEACRQYKIPKLIYTSSPSVAFDGRDQSGLDESCGYAGEWLAHYPRSKKMGEEAVLMANGEALKTVALRPHLIWGPGDHHLIPRLIDRAKKGQLGIVGDGQNEVDVIYVENAARAHLLAAQELDGQARCAGKAYFLGQDNPVKLWEFVAEVLKRADAPPVTKRVPFWLAYQAGFLMEWGYRILGKKEEPRMTRFLACQLSKDHYYSHKAAENDFGYRADISVEEGLDRLFSGSPQ